MPRSAPAILLAALAAAPACRTAAPEAHSFLGEPLYRPPMTREAHARHARQLAEAVAERERAPTDELAIVWHGRRLAYLGRFREALDVFGQGLALHPGSVRLLRHRGHRHLTVREPERAVADLTRAALLMNGEPDALEPDGLPNPAGVPRTTTRFNVDYHLGLAHWVRGDLEAARSAYERCLLAAAANDDMESAVTYWLYLVLRRSGRDEEARALLASVPEEPELLENGTYHRLLQHFRGRLGPDGVLAGAEPGSVDWATASYGLACAARHAGDEEAARGLLERIVAAGPWPAFGCLAAEADLARWEQAGP